MNILAYNLSSMAEAKQNVPAYRKLLICPRINYLGIGTIVVFALGHVLMKIYEMRKVIRREAL